MRLYQIAVTDQGAGMGGCLVCLGGTGLKTDCQLENMKLRDSLRVLGVDGKVVCQ